jgi:hypothetical protein
MNEKLLAKVRGENGVGIVTLFYHAARGLFEAR